MSNRQMQFIFLAISLLILAVVGFFIFRPFLITLIMACVFASVLRPVFKYILTKFKFSTGSASILTVLLFLLIVLVPLFFISYQLLAEAKLVYVYLTEGSGRDSVLNVFNSAVGYLQDNYDIGNASSFEVEEYAKQGAGWLLSNLGSLFSNIAGVVLNVFIFLVALYYLLKDGTRLKKFLLVLSPLADSMDKTILDKMRQAVNSVIRGSLLIAIIQGILTTFGFMLFGVPNPVLWGSVAAVAALIPAVGTALVLVPAIVYLFITSSVGGAIGLLIWGAVAVGFIDNLLGPRLIGHGIELHPLMVLLAVLGGISFFGPVGFIIGPLVISLVFAVLDSLFSFKRTESI